MRKISKNEIGITLIALVITIVVLLILAGVTIATLTGDNGLITKTNEAKKETEQAGDKELIRLAVSEARIGENGFQELNANTLQEAIDNQFDERNAVVSDNGDGTFTVSCLDTLKDYKVTSNNIENALDWNEVMSNAVAPGSQDEARNEGVIGIGTDGKPVDMDLWEYTFDESTNGYGLNDSVSLSTTASAEASKGYSGTNFDNIIIPQYISIDNGSTWSTVTNLDWTFFNCTDLQRIDVLPITVKSMRYTFRGCTGLTEICKLPNKLENLMCTFFNSSLINMPTIPNSVNNMYGTFNQCQKLTTVTSIPTGIRDLNQTFRFCASLESAPILPEGVEILNLTFNGCTSLKSCPLIPATVQSMESTFEGCTSLESATTIPSSVTNITKTFYGCINLKGELEINATVTGKVTTGADGYNREDYFRMLYNVATSDNNLGLKIFGNCKFLNEIIAQSNSSNISLK